MPAAPVPAPAQARSPEARPEGAALEESLLLLSRPTIRRRRRRRRRRRETEGKTALPVVLA